MRGKTLIGEITGISTYNEGYFTLRIPGGMTYTCLVENRDKWDILYDYMSRPVFKCIVTCDNVGPDNSVTVKI